MNAPAASSHTWRDEGRDLMRGVGGAAIIGVPLIYTMEMWRLAAALSPRAILVLIVCALVANTGYNLVSGFREGAGLIDAVRDAIESYALGFAFAFGLLALLDVVRVGGADDGRLLLDAVSKVAVEALPLSIGISIASTQFSGGGAEGGNQKRVERRYPDLAEAGIAAAGSLVFAFNVAPTEEIFLLATRLTWGHLVALVIASLALSYGMIFVADFSGRDRRRQSTGPLQTPVGETLLAYALALLVSLALIYAFHALAFSISPYTTLGATVVLALPATIGGAVGRLLV